MWFSAIFQSNCDGVWMCRELTFRELNYYSRNTWHEIPTVTNKIKIYWYKCTGPTSSGFLVLFFNAEHKEKEQLVPFLNSLVWLSQGSNPQFQLNLMTNSHHKPFKHQAKFVADNILNCFAFFFVLFFRENKSCHFMWIVCPVDNTHEMSRLVFSEK